jgi:hypothetical protein
LPTKTHVIVEFDASEVLSVKTGTEIHIRRKNARVINLFVEQIELDLRGRTFGREGEAAFDVLRQDSGVTAQRDIALGLSMFASERRKVFDRRCRFLRISRLHGRPGQRRPQNAGSASQHRVATKNPMPLRWTIRLPLNYSTNFF